MSSSPPRPQSSKLKSKRRYDFTKSGVYFARRSTSICYFVNIDILGKGFENRSMLFGAGAHFANTGIKSSYRCGMPPAGPPRPTPFRSTSTRSRPGSCRSEACGRPPAPSEPGMSIHWLPDEVGTNKYLLQKGYKSPALCNSLSKCAHFATCCHNMLPHFAACYNIFASKPTMGNCGTSVITPFVLTPSGSCRFIVTAREEVVK